MPGKLLPFVRKFPILFFRLFCHKTNEKKSEIRKLLSRQPFFSFFEDQPLNTRKNEDEKKYEQSNWKKRMKIISIPKS